MKSDTMQALPADLQELYKEALRVQKNSYSPYSGYPVGAAIRTQSGKIYTGCNVENSSFGGTVCAERVAIFKAVSEEGRIEIASAVVVTDATPAWPPCGFCRQVFSEFSGADTPIIAANLQGATQIFRFQDLMPAAFTPAHLHKHPKK